MDTKYKNYKDPVNNTNEVADYYNALLKAKTVTDQVKQHYQTLAQAAEVL